MNIILFRSSEVQLPLSRRDPRAAHILEVLKRQPGATFDAGLINGPRGKGRLESSNAEEVRLSFVWGEPPPPLSPLVLVVGLPRPQTARDILRDATTLGVSALHFVHTNRGEASYADSSLWKTDAWKECVISGAAQAFCTQLPEVTHGRSLAETITTLPTPQTRLTLDNYESPVSLNEAALMPNQPVTLAIGAERGWSAEERILLRQNGFAFVHLGARVLRTETACVAAITLLKSRLGWL